MEKTDVLVIGGSAAGIVAATTGKSFYPDKAFLVIRREKQVIVPCGIPYIFGSLDNSEQDVIPDEALTSKGVRLKIDEAISIDHKNKVCKSAEGTEIGFEKLVLALGSSPVVPKWLKGSDLENVFTIPKDKKRETKSRRSLQIAIKLLLLGAVLSALSWRMR